MKPREALVVEYRPLGALIPYARNARTHSPQQVEKIAASIREFGWTNPVLIDEEGGIIAGHGRVMAGQRLGIEQAPCIVLAGLTPAQKRAYVLADNQLALNAGWDLQLLGAEIAALQAEGYGAAMLGFSDEELRGLQAIGNGSGGLTDPDSAPAAPVVPTSQIGDVWILGRHRIVCGDATAADDWAKLDVGQDFVAFASPPYNAGDAAGLRDRYRPGVPKTNKFYAEYSDDLSGDAYVDLLSDTVRTAFTQVDTIALNLQPLAGSKRPLLRWMHEWSTHLVDVITWDKGKGAPHIQPGIMASRFEWIVVMSRTENASRVIPHSSWQGKFSNVYQAPPQFRNEYSAIHGATFPVHLPEFVVGDLMNRCRGVVDCYLGTGTTIIAAEKLGRDGRGIELSPAYVDVAVRRWQEFTGANAVLEADGRTFAQVAASRPRPADAEDAA